MGKFFFVMVCLSFGLSIVYAISHNANIYRMFEGTLFVLFFVQKNWLRVFDRTVSSLNIGELK